MPRSARGSFQVVLLLLAGVTGVEAGASGLIEKAREKVEAGTIVAETDLAPIVAALMRTGSSGAADTLISGIVELGDADGTSPAAVKDYLRREAPPALLRIARGKFHWTERGDALMALRSLDADDAVMREAIEVARADRSGESQYIHSRGSLLEDWLDSRRRGGVSIAARPQPKDPGRERQALSMLRERGVGVSANSLSDAAIHGRADVVQALLDAGVPVESPGALLSPIASATAVGCAAGEGPLQGRLETIDVLVKGGADLKSQDQLGNTILLQVAHVCPLPIIRKLVELGAPANPKPNAQGVTPLGMTLISGKWEIAEFLVDSGARITSAEVDMVFIEKPKDPRQVALLKRAQVSGVAK